MSKAFGSAGWHFARVETQLSECAGLLSNLLKQLKARAKKSDDLLAGSECHKANRDSCVRFHKINSERAAQCMIHVLQDFSTEDTASLAACCQAVDSHGFNRTVFWDIAGFRGELTSAEGRKAGRVYWQQSIINRELVSSGAWKDLWQLAANKLGIASMLREKPLGGLTAAEVISDGSSKFHYDSRGFRVYASVRSDFTIGITEIDAVSVETISTQTLAGITGGLGKPSGQWLDFVYSGKYAETTRRLNEILPVSHLVSYILSDSARDKFYPAMFKALRQSQHSLLALPAIEVEREVNTQMQPLLIVNITRTADASWLEFQTTLAPEIFEWIEQILDCSLDHWQGPAETRWGWYGS